MIVEIPREIVNLTLGGWLLSDGIVTGMKVDVWKLDDEVLEWCKENKVRPKNLQLSGGVLGASRPFTVSIWNHKKAVLFKLRWC